MVVYDLCKAFQDSQAGRTMKEQVFTGIIMQVT